MRLFVEEYSDCVPLLLQECASGHVHSIFANGFNIEWGRSLLFIGTRKNGRVPFGIHIDNEAIQQLLNEIQKGDSVSWEVLESALVLGEVKLLLDRATVYTNRITNLNDDYDYAKNLEMLLTVLELEDEVNGLGWRLDTIFDAFMNIKTSPCYPLLHAFTCESEGCIEGTLRSIIGRGKGLTPSGDDLLVGLLAVHFFQEFLSPFFLNVLKELVTTEELTTTVSKEFILYALRGEFSSVVKEFVQEFGKGIDSDWKGKLFDLLSVGHSSGFDTALGITIGMIALRRNIHEQESCHCIRWECYPTTKTTSNL